MFGVRIGTAKIQLQIFREWFPQDILSCMTPERMLVFGLIKDLSDLRGANHVTLSVCSTGESELNQSTRSITLALAPYGWIAASRFCFYLRGFKCGLIWAQRFFTQVGSSSAKNVGFNGLGNIFWAPVTLVQSTGSYLGTSCMHPLGCSRLPNSIMPSNDRQFANYTVNFWIIIESLIESSFEYHLPELEKFILNFI